jgi:hypothetical protein
MKSIQQITSKWISRMSCLLIVLCLLTLQSNGQIVISGYHANPGGTDSPYEYVQLKATTAIDFSVTPYSVVFNNNGTPSSNGWAAGGALTYKFNLTTGTVAQGDVFYVGGDGMTINGSGTLDLSTEVWIRSIQTGTTPGDGFGNSNSTGVLGNAGTTADGIAVFSGTTVTASTIPVDAIFFGSTIGASMVPGSGGYVMPNNDRYVNANVMGAGSNTYLFVNNSASGAYTKLTGTYNVNSATWTTARTGAIVSNPTILSEISSGITLDTGSPTISVNTSGFNGSFGSITIGNVSDTSSFTVEGSTLVGNIVITPPAGGFEIRTGVNAFSTGAITLVPVAQSVALTTIDVRFNPSIAGLQSGDITAASTSATTVNIPVSGTGVAVVPPVKLSVVSVNGGSSPIVANAFDVVVNAVDNGDVPQNVLSNTTVQLSVNTGSGSLSGVISGVMTAGTSQVTISGATYAPAETGVILSADAIAGDVLTSGLSSSFNVLDTASFMFMNNAPSSGLVATNLSTFTIQARRADNTIDFNYVGSFTISLAAGPGNISGTLSKPAVNGVASFSDIQFDQPGAYTLKVSSGFLPDFFSNTIVITLNPVLTELVVPSFMGAKTSASGNNARTPIAVCVQIDNLLPFTTYDVKLGLGLTSDAATVIGAGNVWNGTAFLGSDVLGAFTTDASGSSGPFWAYIQPTGNGSRFDAGQVHNIRMNFVPTGNTLNTTPKVVGSKSITALDISTSARTVSTADDGAFFTGTSYDCTSGKYLLVYDNVSGTGNPLYVYQVGATTAVNSTQSDLPAAINNFYTQTGTNPGDFGGVIPIGANNPNGIRRIELRNADNTLYGFHSDADGIWPSGANTTSVLRRSVTALTLSDSPFSTASASIAGDNSICAGGSSNLTLTFAGTGPWTYAINGDAPVITSNNPEIVSVSPVVTTVYTITSFTDANCTGAITGTATITVDNAPPANSVTVAPLPGSGCNGEIILVNTNAVANATSYTWSAPSGTLINGMPGPFSTATNSATITLGNVLANSSGWNICAFASNACGVTNTNCKFIRGALSTPAPISGSSFACSNTSAAYSTTAVAGASSYTWSVTGDASVIGTTTSATVNFGPAFTSGTLCVRGVLPCGYNGPQRCMTISNGVGALGLMSGSFNVCPGQTNVVYSVAPVANAASYAWTVPANVSITSGQGTNSVTVSIGSGFNVGTICVTATSVCGIVSPARCKSIVSDKPAMPGNISGALTGICNQAITYSVAAQAGVSSYNWSVPSGSSLTSSNGTNSADVLFTNSFTTGQLCVTAQNSCGSSSARCVNVKGAPSTPGIISGSASVCPNEQGLTYSVSSVFGATNYLWSVPSSASVVAGQGSSNLIADWGANSGNVTVIASNTCGTSGTRVLAVTVIGCKLIGENYTSDFEIYPNPSNGIVHVNSSMEEDFTIELFELSGRLVSVPVFSTDRIQTIDISSISSGMYFIVITNSSGTSEKHKIVKN